MALPLKAKYPNISEWFHAVQERDGHTCRICGAVDVNAHHILPRSYFPQKERELNNGVTLYRRCHCLAHRNWFGSTGGHKYSCTRAASELSLRDKSNDNHVLIARLVVGDAVNSILSYEKKGDVVSANSLRDDIDRLCALLQCQPGDLVEYEEVKPDA